MKLHLNVTGGPAPLRSGRGAGPRAPFWRRWFQRSPAAPAFAPRPAPSAAPGWSAVLDGLRALPSVLTDAVRGASRPGPGVQAVPPVVLAVEAAHDRDRLRWLWGAHVSVAALVLLRLFLIQIVWYPRYSSISKRQHVAAYKLPASRGAIMDRNGRVLAESQEGAAVYLMPRYFFADKTGIRSKLQRVCGLLGRSVASVRAEAARKSFVWLKRPATTADVERIQEVCRTERIQGIGWEPLCLRHYPEGRTACQLLGFTNDEGHGLEGVEFGYDRYLHRDAARMTVIRDSLGRTIFTGGGPDEDAQSASSLTLTIDTTLQYATEREMERGMVRAGAKWGCALVMDPSTGELLALANVPRYSPDAFAGAPADVRANHAVSSVFEPGSVFKLVALSAALEDKVAGERDVYDCERGAYLLGNEVIHDVEPYGRLSVAEMFAYSSNIGFAKLGMKVGASRLLAMAKRFGFGEPTRVGLPGEERGLLRKPIEPFDIAALAFGQGVGTTAIQIAAAYGAIANGGNLMRPYVVREARDARGHLVLVNRPEPVRKVVSADLARRLVELMSGVVEFGTGQPAAIKGIKVAGKTGTAQKSNAKGYLPDGDKLVTFVGFFPADNPKFLVLVSMDRPKWGTAGGVVGPVFREIALAAVRQFGVPTGPAGPLARGTALPAHGPAGRGAASKASPAEPLAGAVPGTRSSPAGPLASAAGSMDGAGRTGEPPRTAQ